jgi:hypothetical protein
LSIIGNRKEIEMTASQTEMKMNKTRKLIFQLVSGGIVGGLAGYLGVGLLDAEKMAVDQIIVSGVGLVYLLMGVIVGFGLIAPRLGSGILNVEDADEIREQRRVLTGSTICMVALGAALMALPMAGPGGAISPLAGLGGLLAALAILPIITIRDWKYYDEMLWDVSRDAGNLAFSGIGGGLLIWASAAWLGLAVAPTPLGLVALITGGFLLAIFVASARKGLLRPR